MDACWEASVRATTVLYCMLMNRGVRSPAESLMLPSRWSYTGTHHLSFQYDIYAPQLSERFMCENAKDQSAKVFPRSPFFFLSAGASYAGLPTPPQAQQDLLVLTMPAPQGSRVACWVPHFSTGIPANAVGLPQECFLTTASVTGTNREQGREGEKGNTVIRSEKQRCHTQTLHLTERLTLACQDYCCSIVGEHDPSGTSCIEALLYL